MGHTNVKCKMVHVYHFGTTWYTFTYHCYTCTIGTYLFWYHGTDGIAILSTNGTMMVLDVVLVTNGTRLLHDDMTTIQHALTSLAYLAQIAIGQAQRFSPSIT